jgi:hypothetical protein
MKSSTRIAVGAAIVAALVGAMNANAWVAAARGGFGGHTVVAAGGGYHGAYYHSNGCNGCGAAAGAVAGLAVGVAAGAAIADASHPTTVVVQQTTYAAQGNVPLGTQVAVVPPGSTNEVVNGVTYYQSGPTWYKPYYGSSGVYYEVVPAP